MDADSEAKVKEYINHNEETQWLWKLAETIADLAWIEKETKEGFLGKWLKNDENLLLYAELTMKTEKLSVWESIRRKLLELKLWVTCPYFADFKNFLGELKRWTVISTTDNSTSSSTTESSTSRTSTFGRVSTETTPWSNWATTESNETWKQHMFCGTSINNIKSEPFEKNSKTWVTWCSRTARNNWRNFWIILPSWDAYDAGKLPWKNCIKSIPEDKRENRPQNSWKWIDLPKFKSINKWNYADIYVESKSNYGHRAVAFRDDSGQWYVLDPYTRVNWRLDNSPKKLKDYLKARKIVKAHIYESKWYKKDSSSVYDDQWTGYEWWNG